MGLIPAFRQMRVCRFSKLVRMATEPQSFLTPEEYLAIERKAESKSEYWHGQTFAMAGVSRYHDRIARNVITALTVGLRTTNCQTYTSDMRLHIPATGL
jgi:Uma2 family endonuclease